MNDTAAEARPPSKDLPALALLLALSFVVAWVGGAATFDNVRTWYPGLAKPAFNPPNWVFGPVWTVLYVLMAVAAWRVWRRRTSPGVRLALGLYGLQLALNLAWSVIFFGLHQIGAALAEILALLAAILATTLAFWRIDRPAAVMFAPYLAWVSFATALNLAIWQLN